MVRIGDSHMEGFASTQIGERINRLVVDIGIPLHEIVSFLVFNHSKSLIYIKVKGRIQFVHMQA